MLLEKQNGCVEADSPYKMDEFPVFNAVPKFLKPCRSNYKKNHTMALTFAKLLFGLLYSYCICQGNLKTKWYLQFVHQPLGPSHDKFFKR